MDPMEISDSLEPIENKDAIDLSDNSSERANNIQVFADETAELVDNQDCSDSNSDLKALKARLEELEEFRRNEENKYNRLLADFHNLRSRTSKEVQLGVELAEKHVLLEVLQVLDSFNRCLSADYHDFAVFRKGVGLIQKQFYDTLRRLKVTEIEIQVGDMFDAHVAEALTTINTTAYPEGSVVDVCEKGFKIGDQLLRPARVVVAQGDSSYEDVLA